VHLEEMLVVEDGLVAEVDLLGVVVVGDGLEAEVDLPSVVEGAVLLGVGGVGEGVAVSQFPPMI
jgi:hypothetical protein